MELPGKDAGGRQKLKLEAHGHRGQGEVVGPSAAKLDELERRRQPVALDDLQDSTRLHGNTRLHDGKGRLIVFWGVAANPISLSARTHPGAYA